MAGLFRREAVDHRRQRLWGDVIMVQPLSSTVMAGVLLAIVALAGAVLVFGSYARTALAPGLLVPQQGSVRIYAPQAGVVASVMVSEGDTVAAGETLMTVETEQPMMNGESAEARSLLLLAQQRATLGERIALERERGALERRRLETEITSLEAELEALRAQRRMQTAITASARASFEELGSIVEKGYVARTEYERRRQSYLAQQQAERALDQRLIGLERDLAQARLALEQLPNQLADKISQLESEVAALDQRRAELERRRAYSVVAPVAGRVAAVQALRGEPAMPERPLLVLLPEGSHLEAELYVPSRAIGFVREGQSVRLLYDAFPYQRFGSYPGVVRAVTKTI
ncbi:MAG: HlyD family efflux transporter periplasmic adaptor subunit, partial [Alphaproteobacteria bacterium]